MTVHFIGAGPGAADLITVRGQRLLAACDLCLYAGSTVNQELLEYCSASARKVNTASLDLQQLEHEYMCAWQQGQQVVRLHSGDLSLYSALAEQLRVLERLGIPYTLTPGVPAFAAAAAAIGRELTLPEVAQSLVLTRLSGRASKMPEGEQLEHFAKTRATLALHLAIHRLDEIVERLRPFYGEDCPAAVVYRASWEEQQIVTAPLAKLVEACAQHRFERSALVLVGRALGEVEFNNSALYRSDYCRRFR
ncbi:precorrin-4 C(11)-methyltransferase [Carnimonas bestiolae]|uniref:precorrin-4 C(11)-methyltransferase n=1 Tax=Carnimonas bestiolae TaxID=3402172 RepID=UPI003EDC0A2F